MNSIKLGDRVTHQDGWKGTIVKIVRPSQYEDGMYAIRQYNKPNSYRVIHEASLSKTKENCNESISD